MGFRGGLDLAVPKSGSPAALKDPLAPGRLRGAFWDGELPRSQRLEEFPDRNF